MSLLAGPGPAEQLASPTVRLPRPSQSILHPYLSPSGQDSHLAAAAATSNWSRQPARPPMSPWGPCGRIPSLSLSFLFFLFLSP